MLLSHREHDSCLGEISKQVFGRIFSVHLQRHLSGRPGFHRSLCIVLFCEKKMKDLQHQRLVLQTNSRYSWKAASPSYSISLICHVGL